MTSLEDSVKKHARSFIWSADDEYYGDWEYEVEKIKDWADEYIKELEEYIKKWDRDYPYPADLNDTLEEVIKFLRGETET